MGVPLTGATVALVGDVMESVAQTGLPVPETHADRAISLNRGIPVARSRASVDHVLPAVMPAVIAVPAVTRVRVESAGNNAQLLLRSR